MKTRDEQASEYSLALHEAVGEKLKAHKKKPSGYFHGFDLNLAFRAGWDAALKSQWRDTRVERPAHLQRCFCYDKHMPGVYCYVYDDIDKYWCNQYLEEHDPNGDMHVSDYADYRITHWMPIPDLP